MSLSSTGIASGLDIQAIVSKLGALQRAPLTALQASAATTQSKISALASLRSKLNDVQEAASALRNPATWSSWKVKSSNALAVAASGLNTATSGGFTVDVTSVAKAQAMASGVMFPAGAGWSPGVLTLELGQWTVQPATAFQANGGVPVAVSVNAGDTTSMIAEKINSAQTQVRASVISDGAGGERLFLQGTETGAANGFRMSVQDADGNDNDNQGLSTLMQGSIMGQYASNAAITVDGVPLSSSTNTFEVLGTKLTVNATGSSKITTSLDDDRQKEAVSTFVKAYNAFNTYLNDITAYDATTKKAGVLQGDSTARSMQNGLRSLVSSVFTEREAYTFGITIERGGSLKWDESKWSATDASTRQATLQNAGTQINNRLQSLLGTGGIFDTQATTYTAMLKRNQNQQTLVNDRADKAEANYLRQFQGLDSKLTNMQAMAAYWNTQNS